VILFHRPLPLARQDGALAHGMFDRSSVRKQLRPAWLTPCKYWTRRISLWISLWTNADSPGSQGWRISFLIIGLLHRQCADPYKSRAWTRNLLCCLIFDSKSLIHRIGARVCITGYFRV